MDPNFDRHLSHPNAWFYSSRNGKTEVSQHKWDTLDVNHNYRALLTRHVNSFHLFLNILNLTWSLRTIPLTDVVDCMWSFFSLAFIITFLFCMKRSPFFILAKGLKAYFSNHRNSNWIQFSELIKMLMLSHLFWITGSRSMVARSHLLELWISHVEVLSWIVARVWLGFDLPLDYLLSSNMHHQQSSPKSRLYI